MKKLIIAAATLLATTTASYGAMENISAEDYFDNIHNYFYAELLDDGSVNAWYVSAADQAAEQAFHEAQNQLAAEEAWINARSEIDDQPDTSRSDYERATDGGRDIRYFLPVGGWRYQAFYVSEDANGNQKSDRTHWLLPNNVTYVPNTSIQQRQDAQDAADRAWDENKGPNVQEREDLQGETGPRGGPDVGENNLDDHDRQTFDRYRTCQNNARNWGIDDVSDATYYDQQTGFYESCSGVVEAFNSYD